MIKLFIAGHNGLVGNSMFKCFSNDPKYSILKKSRKQLDLTDFKKTEEFLLRYRASILNLGKDFDMGMGLVQKRTLLIILMIVF